MACVRREIYIFARHTHRPGEGRTKINDQVERFTLCARFKEIFITGIENYLIWVVQFFQGLDLRFRFDATSMKNFVYTLIKFSYFVAFSEYMNFT